MESLTSQVTGLTGQARKLSVLALVTLILFWPSPKPVNAAAGDLDPTFGDGGKVITDFFGGRDFARSIAIQGDGKIIGAGVHSIGSCTCSEDFAIARYNVDGSLDSTFGSGGRVITDFFGQDDEISAIAIQSDGKIVAVGGGRSSTAIFMALARYNTDGTLDSSFGSDGKVAIDLFGGGSRAGAVTIQPNGRIVVAGRAAHLDSSGNFGLARFNSDGSLDTSFASGGKVDSDKQIVASALALRPDGKIIVGGTIFNNKSHSDSILLRYNGDGSLDSSFGLKGQTVSDFFGGFDFLDSLALQGDGKIVAVGDIELSDDLHAETAVALVRYESDGRLDSNFGSRGRVVINPPFFIGHSVLLQPNGKIILAGGGDAGETTDTNMALVRFNTNGSLDMSFGFGGKAVVVFSRPAAAQAAAIQADGKIVTLGYISQTGSDDEVFALARFLTDEGSFDICLQDDGNGGILQLNSTTGDYQFTDCSGLTISGTGSVIKKDGIITLQHTAADRRVFARVVTSANKATATIQLPSRGAPFTIMDRDVANNTCECR